MARPRKNAPPDQFTSSELAAAAGLSPRNFGLLVDRGLSPQPIYGSDGKGSVRSYDTEALKHVAIVGALYGGGIDLLPAARLGAVVADDLGSSYYTVPSKLDRYLQHPLNPRPGHYPWDDQPDDKRMRGEIRDDFWLHYFLRSRSTIYHPSEALVGDFMLEIADRRHVFIGVQGDAGNLQHEDAEYRLIGWDRGADEVHVEHFNDYARVSVRNPDPAADERARVLAVEFASARRNAVALVRINISLAVRNAFDRLYDHRAAVGATFDWMATAKPPPGRYAGGDDRGYPLDPNHPWNLNLSSSERSKREVEIEEYVTRREAGQRDKEGDS